MISVERWQEALDIQNACNLSGLVLSFPDVITALREGCAGDSAAIAHHPIIRLWLDKLCDLAGLTVQQGPILDAYRTARAHGAIVR